MPIKILITSTYSMPMLPPEHKGFIEKRVWHKVKWAKNPYPDRTQWVGIEGKFDLMADEDLERFRDFVEIIKTIEVPKCETALGLRFGVTKEEDINNWIEKHTG